MSDGLIVDVTGSPVGANTTSPYTADMRDEEGNEIPGSVLDAMTLTIIDTLSGAIVNGCQNVDILNTGRGTIDETGHLTINLETGDTDMSEVPGASMVQRSLIINWTMNDGTTLRSHRANFFVRNLLNP
jgi:hypothetical protein